MTRKQEIELIRRIRAGNWQAEDELFNHYIERIAWQVRMKLGSDHEDWKDVASDCLIAALICLREGKFDLKQGNLGSYIYGITKNKSRDYFKKKKKKDEKEVRIDEMITAATTDEESELERMELHENAVNIINELPLKYRQVLKLTLCEGFSVKQISQELKIPPEEVSKRLWYGKKLFKKKYKI